MKEKINFLLESGARALFPFVVRLDLKDSLRGDKPRIEMAAAALMSASVSHSFSQDEFDQVIDVLKANQQHDGYWLEHSYQVSDEDIGFYGAVPTSFCIVALALYYKLIQARKDVLLMAVRAADYIYYHENKGHVRKSFVNKGDVLNTNLIAAVALSFVADVLPQGSYRCTLYRELVGRVVSRTLKFQSWRGRFPYHHNTFRTPILYQAMTVGILDVLNVQDNFPLLSWVLKAGRHALCLFWDFQRGRIVWGRANCKDKEGAVWAYSFSLLCFVGHSNELSVKCLSRLNELNSDGLYATGDFSGTRDPFYSAWVLLGLTLASVRLNASQSKFVPAPIGGRLALRAMNAYYFAKCGVTYIVNRLRQRVLPYGSVDNATWYK